MKDSRPADSPKRKWVAGELDKTSGNAADAVAVDVAVVDAAAVVVDVDAAGISGTDKMQERRMGRNGGV